MTQATLASVLSFLLPCLLYAQAILRLFKAASLKRAWYTVAPAISFAFTSLWLSSSIRSHWAGGLPAESVQAQLSIGPLFFGFLLVLVEVPFLAAWLYTARAPKRRA
ncbi:MULTISPECIES: hypothetical protein [unclassified Variovorax]|uniref:hypothetical protein n=1 Tax=unclassified Variovorax TaxID=663243 RepID=UPI00076CB12A|nr:MULTISPECIES: hypothetical protein [unclassified Variovorax]KWT98441.1 hypothetical protein APY03_0576 [Variovorax sp. WDL1]PNG49890.1 hypothetical protein CHC06_05471 [Variovorax sp. B2]PNG50762.1 hypothetical protein CHC07_05376 [Variovorax sp. B4]VTU42147.1 hypothetical protein H6P1_00118 [Variovorax sp. PBL-H6]VTU44216.1 hypothetical protein SRS16P1_00784 [Variovorax sp. SRS16]